MSVKLPSFLCPQLSLFFSSFYFLAVVDIKYLPLMKTNLNCSIDYLDKAAGSLVWSFHLFQEEKAS